MTFKRDDDKYMMIVGFCLFLYNTNFSTNSEGFMTPPKRQRVPDILKLVNIRILPGPWRLGLGVSITIIII